MEKIQLALTHRLWDYLRFTWDDKSYRDAENPSRLHRCSQPQRRKYARVWEKGEKTLKKLL